MTVGLDVLVLPAFTDLAGLPGERDPWLDAYDLERTLDPGGVPEPLHYGEEGLGVVPTGVGKSAAAATTTALLTSDELDLSGTLVLSVGIAGGPPTEVTVGSVVVAETIVDWDNKCRWSPDESGEPNTVGKNPYNAEKGAFAVDPALVEWATRTAADVDLADDEVVLDHCREFEAEAARSEPSVVTGVNVCSDELWHGRAVAENVQTLVEEYDAGTYRATEMEDSGTAFALDRFGRLDEYLSVRGVSNFDRPAPGQSVEESLAGDDFEAGVPLGLENAVRVAREIVDERLDRTT